MLTFGLLLTLAVLQPPAVDSLAVYAAILEQVRGEFPARPVALARTRSGVECMPLCGVRTRDPDGTAETVLVAPEVEHSAELLDSLRARRLIDDTCAVREGVYGCIDYPQHLFIALGEITAHPKRGPEPVGDGVWVQVALLIPCAVDCAAQQGRTGYHPDAFGYWYLMRPGCDGTWTIVRRAPGFTT
jgi:hypothetical protein